GLPLPPGTSASWMPPSSLYWIQKSASSSSSAAGNRSSAASPGVRPPLALAVRVLIKNPAPTVPATMAPELRRNERRLIELFRGLTLFSESPSKGRFSLLRGLFAVGLLIVFTLQNRSNSPRSLHGKGNQVVTFAKLLSCGDPRRIDSHGHAAWWWRSFQAGD